MVRSDRRLEQLARAGAQSLSPKLRLWKWRRSRKKYFPGRFQRTCKGWPLALTTCYRSLSLCGTTLMLLGSLPLMRLVAMTRSPTLGPILIWNAWEQWTTCITCSEGRLPLFYSTLVYTVADPFLQPQSTTLYQSCHPEHGCKCQSAVVTTSVSHKDLSPVLSKLIRNSTTAIKPH